MLGYLRFRKQTGQVVDLKVGRRTKTNLKTVMGS